MPIAPANPAAALAAAIALAGLAHGQGATNNPPAISTNAPPPTPAFSVIPPGWKEIPPKGQYLRFFTADSTAYFGVIHNSRPSTTKSAFEDVTRDLTRKFDAVDFSPSELVMLDRRMWVRFEVNFKSGRSYFTAIYYLRGDETGSTEMRGWAPTPNFNRYREAIFTIAANYETVPHTNVVEEATPPLAEPAPQPAP